jgi:phenylacetic acid degradation operon negative regulatory protein
VRARSALFTLLGDVVRPGGGEAWLTPLTEAMVALGFTAQATRTALHRMTNQGWVEPRRVGRYAAYRLTGKGADRLREAAERIYRLEATQWDGRWHLLLADLTDVPPPSPAALSLRSADAGASAARGELARTLRWMGFGSLPGGIWVSPHDHGEQLEALLTAAGVRQSALSFVSHGAVAGKITQADRRIVTQAWDLGQLRVAHAAFLERWVDQEPPHDPRQAFATRIRLVHDWRSFLFLDPGLPGPLLPDDWLGQRAATCFHDLYARLAPQAQAWWDDVTAGVPTSSAQTA